MRSSSRQITPSASLGQIGLKSRPELGVRATNVTFITPECSERSYLFTMSEIFDASIQSGSIWRVTLWPGGRTASAIVISRTRARQRALSKTSSLKTTSLGDERNPVTSKIPAGGARRDRTDDLLLAKQALSQLSYGPMSLVSMSCGLMS